MHGVPLVQSGTQLTSFSPRRFSSGYDDLYVPIRSPAVEGQGPQVIVKRRNYTLMSFLAAAGLLKLGLILSVMFLRKGVAKPNVLVFKMPDDLRLVPYKNHTTVADTPGLCDPISRKIYARNGSVADCAVAFVLCMAVVAPHRIGLAGGFFATVYIRQSKNISVLDAREAAPSDINKSEINTNSSRLPLIGGRSVAVPALVPGLEALHLRFGKLPWASLFEDAIRLARFGFPVYAELAAVLDKYAKAVFQRHTLRKRRNYTLMSFLAAAGLLKLGLILSVMFLRKGVAKPNVLVFRMPDDLRLVPFKNHTTVADTPGLCDPISRKIYARNGSVADCAVAFVLCMAVVAPHRIGLAGGFFATVYIRQSKNISVLDAREAAPSDINKSEINTNSSRLPLIGGRSVAVPALVPGLEALHLRFGKLPWASLFEDAIRLARFGFPVYAELAAVLDKYAKAVFQRHTLRKRRNYTLMSFLAAAGLLKLGLILSVMFLRKGVAKPNVLVFKMPDDLRLVPFKNHTTVADTPGLCDPISRKIYARNGSVADCAVAFVLCMAVVAPHRIGLAGGFFATVYIRQSKNISVLDAREAAPSDINKSEINTNSSRLPLIGGRSVAVPALVPGLEALHLRFGKLPWASLFEDAIRLARFGFPVYAELAAVLDKYAKAVFQRHTLRRLFWNRVSRQVYRENEILRQPTLALTLIQIAHKGYGGFLQGDMGAKFLLDLRQLGALVSRGDLAQYRALWKVPVRSVPLGGVTVHAPPPPGAGSLLAFMLSTMDMFRSSKGDLMDEGALTYHRLVETFKFTLPFREDLGDDQFEDVGDVSGGSGLFVPCGCHGMNGS
ncbi:scoloptoxin SSD14-like [Ixodes scapularis]